MIHILMEEKKKLMQHRDDFLEKGNEKVAESDARALELCGTAR